MTAAQLTAPAIVAWGALAIMLYAYLGYPLLLVAFGRVRRPRPILRSEARPTVTVVVAAWNEEAIIGEKTANTLTQDYPADRLDLVVVSDGSTDRTDAIVEEHAGQSRRVRLLHTKGRQGKSVALNIGVPATTGEIVVLTDANAMFRKEAVAQLVRPFGDPRVGAVSGQLCYRPGEGLKEGEGFYWRYEQRVKRAESALASLLGANGSIYAIRRELFRPLRPRDVNDFVIPYWALLQRRAVILEEDAISYEEAAPSLWGEYRRKVRIMARAIPTMISLLWPTLARGRVFLLWQLISHKLLREIQGLFFLGMLGGAIGGAARGDVALALFAAAQVLLYTLGATAWAAPAVARWRAGRLAAHLDMIALASVAALWLWLTRGVKATWQPARPG